MNKARRDLGERLIVAYKVVKAVAEVLLAFGLVFLAGTGEIESLRTLGIELRRNLASRWSLELGRVISGLLSERGLHFVELGLLLDGAVSAFEGYSLWRGYRWGAWLVVVATALPLPLEVAAIVRHHRFGRVLLAVLNLAIVVYLAVRILRRGAPSLPGLAARRSEYP
ncbi:MAG TPA: DUF2127 domain-containing protein [Anaeromyxobacteraceae bacterium]|nr:DUF2127 domain-containing protein [Anaeromyxobacteraceae bacterium]